MLDWLVVWGVTNAFGFVFKTLLEKLAREDLKKYTQNFFAQILRNFPSDIGIRQKERLEIVFGQALKEFLLQVQQQLEDAELSEAELKQYINSLQQFIHQETALLELGKPFLPDAIPDADILAAIWDELKLLPLPADFNWQSLTRRYTKKIKAILRESDELDFILNAQNIAVIQQNLQEIAGIVPDFDLMRYRAEIQKFYGHLRLDSFDTSGYSYSLKLWNMFVAQNVREVNEALPQVYELPKEHLERLQRSGQLEEDFDIQPEILEQYKKSYAQQSSRSVLEVIDEPQTGKYLVILGDPGSGKSSLLQYLTLQWAETPIQDISSLPIPLLIELRTYVRSRDNQECQSFLEFFQQGSGFICSLNQYQLDTLLKTGKAFVMFDGLDEVFEPSKREEAITDIINFTHNYPLVRVLVTSRVIGYQPQRLRDISFRHFMLQDLEREQIQAFINRWHNFAFSDPLEKQRKKERLERVIQDYPAIRQLAVNPLLLTMMAILNRNQELPRDRSELYSQASRVLLQQWDLEKLLIQVESATIDYKDKQGMLRQVAYRMQTSEKGLAGNLINKDDLENILIDYLYSIEVHQGEKIAQLIIEQLRERNFILCFLGADYYAFVHRTFLEYFCAWEFVWQFEKERSITIEFLKTEVFGKHWRDESWREVLRLITGMLEPKFAGDIIDDFIEEYDEQINEWCEVEVIDILILASECMSDVRNRLAIRSTDNKLVERLKKLVEVYAPYSGEDMAHSLPEEEANLIDTISTKVISIITTTWSNHVETLPWLKKLAIGYGYMAAMAVRELVRGWKDDPDTLPILKSLAQAIHYGENTYRENTSAYAAIQELARGWKDDPDTLPMLKSLTQFSEDTSIQTMAVRELARGWKDDPDTLPMLKSLAQSSEDKSIQTMAVRELARGWKDDPDTLPILKSLLQSSNDWVVQSTVLQELAQGWKNQPNILSFILSFLKESAQLDNFGYLKHNVMEELIKSWQTSSEIYDFLYECAVDDSFNPIFLDFSTDSTSNSNQVPSRQIALKVIIEQYPQYPKTLQLLRDLVKNDPDEKVRNFVQQKLKQWGE